MALWIAHTAHRIIHSTRNGLSPRIQVVQCINPATANRGDIGMAGERISLLSDLRGKTNFHLSEVPVKIAVAGFLPEKYLEDLHLAPTPRGTGRRELPDRTTREELDILHPMSGKTWKEEWLLWTEEGNDTK